MKCVSILDVNNLFRCLARKGSNVISSNGFITASSNTGRNDTNDVSVTVGANTMLTISNVNDRVSSSSGLRRSRSGLPMLGTSGLMTLPHEKSSFSNIAQKQSNTYTSTLPSNRGAKSNLTLNKKRNRISTVYLQGNSPSRNVDQNVNSPVCDTFKIRQKSSASNTMVRLKEGLERSDSLVTIMGATVNTTATGANPSDQTQCNCEEKVTVNGQHLHCPSTKDGRHPLANYEASDVYSTYPPRPPPIDYPAADSDSAPYSPSIDLRELPKERRQIRDEDEVFRFDPSFHSALANDFQNYQPVLVDRSTNTSNRVTPVSINSNPEDNTIVADNYTINNNFSASNSEASQTQPNSLIII